MLVDIQSLKSANIPVIIFGAGVAGEAVFHACQDSGIKVKCFCDNNSGKTGELLGIPVEYAPEYGTALTQPQGSNAPGWVLPV